MIYDGQYCVMTFAIRESCNQIHGNLREGFGICWGYDSEHQGFEAMCEIFVLLVGGASLDVFVYP